MRELVLNHASLGAGDRYRAIEWLKDVISGMAVLVRCGAAGSVLRSARDMTETQCAPGFSLFDALQELRKAGAREEYRFFAGIAAKQALLSDLETKHRFLGCETRDIPSEDGAPLLFCALDDHVAVSFPTHPDWKRDRITVRFDELLPDDTFSAESEEIDHLSRADHADSICRRYRKKLLGGIRSGEELWRRRAEAFPSLFFGLDVEDHTKNIPHLRTVVNRLRQLNSAAGRWEDGPAPPFPCKVTNESESLRNNPKLKNTRRFRSRSGAYEFFPWHARFGNGGRIHLRFDAATREVEIGYIGPHLPL